MSLKVSRILHAGYVFECEGTAIAFDPIFENPFSRNCYAFPEIRFDHRQILNLKFAAVFISHFHDDHCSLESLDLLNRATPIYLFCLFEELFEMIRELGFTKVYPLELNQSVKVGPLEVIPRRALDADVDSIFHLRVAGLNVLNVVDSWIDPETLELLKEKAPWDLVLWPFQTMRELEVLSPSRIEKADPELPPEWREQLRALKPKILVPSSCQFLQESWSWYNQAFFPISYRQFEQEMSVLLPSTSVLRLNPGVSVTLTPGKLKNSSPLPWIIPVGDQNVDYKYDPATKPPSTAEIAKHFAPLSAQQLDQVLQYCEVGLLAKFKSMDPPLEEYFEKPRIWQLSLYDHRGSVTNFSYKIDGSQIKKLDLSNKPVEWTTEVPIAKLYAALELGESLTSMYLRINDQRFSSEIENQIQSADMIDDPLIRCLFNGVFGAYQAAQLKRLRGRP